MTIIIPLHAIAAGLFSGLLYVAAFHGLIYGLTLPIATMAPLVYAGLAYGRPGVYVSMVTVSLTVLIGMDPSVSAIIIALSLMPLAFLLRSMMTAVMLQDASRMIWAPLSHGLTIIAVYGAVCHAALVTSDSPWYDEYQASITARMAEESATQEPEVAEILQNAIEQMPHVVLALEFWLQVMVMLATITLVHYIMRSFKPSRRPNVRLFGLPPPDYLLALEALALLVSALGQGAVGVTAQTVLFILLMPHFFCGLSRVHLALLRVPNSRLARLLFLATLLFAWPFCLTILTLYGVWYHVQRYLIARALTKK